MIIVLVSVLASVQASESQEVVAGWPLAEPGLDHENIASVDRAIRTGTYKKINSIIVTRDGQLLVELYYNGANRDSTHNPRSVGKTFAAAVLGIAIEEGYIKSLDQPLSDFYDLTVYDNYSDKKSRVTLRHLVTMTSGFEGYDFDPDSIGNEENMYPQPNWVEWTLNLPMAEDRNPGDEWRYFTAGIVLLGDILNQVVPGGLESYAHDRLLGKIGVSNYQWQHTPQRVANTAGGIQLTPLGFAKFGELHRNGGRWGDETVIPAEWVRAALRPDVQTTDPANRYGYLWWHKAYEVGGETWPVSYCSGNGGNKIFVFEEQDLVIVVTASAYGQRYMHTQVDEIMTRYLLPVLAVR